MKKRTFILLLTLAIALIFLINYQSLDESVENFFTENTTAIVARVIDGDTIVTEEGETIRMLGINTPERGETYYFEAKQALEQQILGKKVILIFGRERYDKYHRGLAYIFLEGQNINKKQVEMGLANFYFPQGRDSYYQEFKEAWEMCIQEANYLCEPSNEPAVQCITIESIIPPAQKFSLENSCNKSIAINNWFIKAEGRKKYPLENGIIFPKENLLIELENNLLNAHGDTIFVRDSATKLISWNHY